MMRLIFHAFVLVTAGAIAVGGWLFLRVNPAALKSLSGTGIVGLSIAVPLVVVFWHGLNRLNSLDDLDVLKSDHRRVIQKKVRNVRAMLQRRIVWLLAGALVVAGLSFVQPYVIYIDNILCVVAPVFYAFVWTKVLGLYDMFIGIEALREKVTNIRRKEQARKNLLNDLRQAKEKQPLQTDAHLEKYKSVFDRSVSGQ